MIDNEPASRGAITPMELAQCRTCLPIGTEFTVAANPKGEHGFAERPMRRGRVTAKYPHVITLDCGTSITYVQILQQRRTGKKFID